MKDNVLPAQPLPNLSFAREKEISGISEGWYLGIQECPYWLLDY